MPLTCSSNLATSLYCETLAVHAISVGKKVPPRKHFAVTSANLHRVRILCTIKRRLFQTPQRIFTDQYIMLETHVCVHSGNSENLSTRTTSHGFFGNFAIIVTEIDVTLRV